MSRASLLPTALTSGLVFVLAAVAAGDALDVAEAAQVKVQDGLRAMFQGARAEACKLFEAALSLDAETVEAHYWLGRLHAQTAASDPASRSRAIHCFQAALALQPYGSYADAVRAWLVRVGGRPERILLFGLSGPSETRQYAAQFMDLLVSKAKGAAGLAARPPEGDAGIPTGVTGLRHLAMDPAGQQYTSGWLVFVSLDSVKTEPVQVGKGRDRRTKWRAEAAATVTVADPIAARALPSFRVETNFLIGLIDTSESCQAAVADALQYIADSAWAGIQRATRPRPDEALDDEMEFPTALTGVFVKSRARSWEDAVSQPFLVFAKTTMADPECGDVAAILTNGVAGRLLATHGIGVLPAPYARSALRALGYDGEGDGGAGPYQELAERLGAKLVVQLSVDGVKTTVRDNLLYCKSVVKVSATVRVFGTADGEAVLCQSLSASRSAKRWGEANADKLPGLRNQCVAEVIDKASAVLGAYLGLALVTENAKQPG